MIQKFERQEIKYLISIKDYNILKKEINKYMIKDHYHKSIIKNIYYDTHNFLLIRRSIEKPVYKEKLRIRCYGINDINDEVFLELKKKYKGVVYKRRINLSYKDAIDFLNHKNINNNSQMLKEIDYFINFHKDICPKVMLTYERESFKSVDDNIRITFDYNIIYRDYDLDLLKPIYGDKILDDNLLVMEVKTNLGYPMWLSNILSKLKIYKTSFSKYGNAYKRLIMKFNEREMIC